MKFPKYPLLALAMPSTHTITILTAIVDGRDPDSPNISPCPQIITIHSVTSSQSFESWPGRKSPSSHQPYLVADRKLQTMIEYPAPRASGLLLKRPTLVPSADLFCTTYLVRSHLRPHLRSTFPAPSTIFHGVGLGGCPCINLRACERPLQVSTKHRANRKVQPDTAR